MSKLTSPRLGFFKVPIAVAHLRALEVAEVPENWMAEPLSGKNGKDFANQEN